MYYTHYKLFKNNSMDLDKKKNSHKVLRTRGI